MTAYYNEIEPYAVQWLRNLISEGLIADGEVDDRSIVDVRPGDLRGFEQCHFFAGLGGWSGALRLAGVRDAEPVWTGSCPCQPFSVAGKRKGFKDERHLWPAWRDLIAQCRPAIVLGEQVASAAEWLRLVRSDLEAMGYAMGAIPVEAASAGSDHLRDRYWFVADGGGAGLAQRERIGEVQHQALEPPARQDTADACALVDDPRERWREGRPEHEVRSGRATATDPGILVDAARLAEREQDDQADAVADGRQAWAVPRGAGDIEWVIGADGKARRVKSGVRLLADGVPARVAKLRALGNAIDLRPAAAFIQAVMS